MLRFSFVVLVLVCQTRCLRRQTDHALMPTEKDKGFSSHVGVAIPSSQIDSTASLVALAERVQASHEKLQHPVLVSASHAQPNESMVDNFGLPRFAFGVDQGKEVGSERSQVTSLSKYMEAVQVLQTGDLVYALAAVYVLALSVAMCSVYGGAKTKDTVKFYANHPHEHAYADSNDIDTFVETFCMAPRKSMVTVIGTSESCTGSQTQNFNISFDISSWVVREPSGFNENDVARLRGFLDPRGNNLERYDVQKTLDWNDWETLEVDIKRKVKEAGYLGEVSVRRETQSVLRVHKNTQWANFVGSFSLRSMVVLTIVGPMFYFPYVAFRSAVTVVRLTYFVDIPTKELWPLIEDRLRKQDLLKDDVDL
eukprot:TRINITY_DN68337_c0_g1_i1.p1 TRINITY_DN68337_c0_g1~~TRINITY_DN68337_c0_g1_i1.p1  ORF type:complete len:367 (+),score=25.46 TRINITY_DN68337_c0_g1_i1:48-1148(+)